MTSSNGNIFCVAGILCGEFPGHWLFPLTMASDAGLWCFLICPWTNSWVKNQYASDLKWNHTHYDITIMLLRIWLHHPSNMSCNLTIFFNHQTHVILSKLAQVHIAIRKLSLLNPLKPDGKSRMKMKLEQRRQAMLQLHLGDRQIYCLLRCTLYQRFYGNQNTPLMNLFVPL